MDFFLLDFNEVFVDFPSGFIKILFFVDFSRKSCNVRVWLEPLAGGYILDPALRKWRTFTRGKVYCETDKKSVYRQFRSQQFWQLKIKKLGASELPSILNP